MIYQIHYISFGYSFISEHDSLQAAQRECELMRRSENIYKYTLYQILDSYELKNYPKGIDKKNHHHSEDSQLSIF